MDKEALNRALAALIAKREELGKIGYDDARYDDLEEELHDMEDDFNDEFGEYMEGVLEEVHNRIAPDSDVLLPTAYLPSAEVPVSAGGKGKKSTPQPNGVWIDSDEYPGKETRLVLLANPPRLVFSVGSKQEEVWTA